MSTWTLPKDWPVIKTVDAHTGGEPLRIILEGLGTIPGATIVEKRSWAEKNLDYVRKGLMWEPRGHADMYGAIPTDPVTEDGDVGVLFLHNEGFSTMCGHGIIAMTKTLLDLNIIKKEGDSPVVKIDSPAGRVTATAHRARGVVERVSFLNVPSFVFKKGIELEVEELGKTNVDIAFGGAFYAFTDATQLGLSLLPKDHDDLVHAGRLIKRKVMDSIKIEHPFEPELGFLYGTIFVGPPEDPAHHSRNVCVFAEGEVDRSPTGTGVSARAALHFDKGDIKPNESITIESILGSCFDVEVAEATEFGGYEAIVPKVTGEAFITGENRFYFDPKDPQKNGFIFR